MPRIASDTGLYKEGKPVVTLAPAAAILKKKQKQKQDEKSTQKDNSESTASSDENNESSSSTKESIIDGETDFEYETDADGNVIDPPEDYDPSATRHPSETSGGTASGRKQSGPSR